MNETLTNSIAGWATGYSHTILKNKEDEIKQGKNYYLASFVVATQFAYLASLISKINVTLPQHSWTTPVKVLCNVAPLLGFPTFLFLAVVKQGDYEDVAEWYHQSKYSYIPLPEKLGGRTVSFLGFFAEHSGNMIRIATLTGSIALIYLGNVAYGGALLAAIAYETIDTMGWIPRRISLFAERYMPTVAFIGGAIDGILLMRVICIFSLSTQLSSSLARYIHYKVDALWRRYFSEPRIINPTLKEIDAPIVRQEQMSFDEIQSILDNDSFRWEFKINPAHCSKSAIDLDDLPLDHHFDEYLSLFDAIDWESKYPLVKKKLQDDERFMDFLFEKYPDVDTEDLASDVDTYIEKLALEAEMTPEGYIANWMREQIVQLVAVLKGEKRVKGSQQDLDETIHTCALLLPQLATLANQVALEDALLKLAIEGGDYCARGGKRASNEVLWGILQNDRQEDEETDNPIKSYELKIAQALQNKRYEMIQESYQLLVEKIEEEMIEIPDQISGDVHSFDLFRLYLSLGCFPLTKFERARIGVSEILAWENYHKERHSFYLEYQWELENVVKGVGEAQFGVYVYQILAENDQLSDKQREEIFDKFQFCNGGKWTYEQTVERFHRLLLVRLGVLISDKAQSDAEAIEEG